MSGAKVSLAAIFSNPPAKISVKQKNEIQTNVSFIFMVDVLTKHWQYIWSYEHQHPV